MIPLIIIAFLVYLLYHGVMSLSTHTLVAIIAVVVVYFVLKGRD